MSEEGKWRNILIFRIYFLSLRNRGGVRAGGGVGWGRGEGWGEGGGEGVGGRKRLNQIHREMGMSVH